MPTLQQGPPAGLSAEDLLEIRAELIEFAEDIFEPMARKDQRRWGEVYLRGLMLDGKRKSIEPMAARLSDGDEQCLQQFVNQSPWEWDPVRARLARRVHAELEPAAWIIDDTGFPKQGKFSVGVARQYCGALGKVGNCQIGVSITAAAQDHSCPVNWRLFIPKEWDSEDEENQQRRRKAHLPDDVRHTEKWRLALEMIKQLKKWGVEPKPVLGDGAYGDVTALRTALSKLGIPYVLDAKGATSAYPDSARPETPPYCGRGPMPSPRYPGKPRSLRELALGAGRKRLKTVTWRAGTRGAMRSRFGAIRIRPANAELRNLARENESELESVWLLYEWPAESARPTDFWLSNLPPKTALAELVGLAKLRWRIESDYREMKDALGLDHFEGRSWRGWHHHVTLVSAAQIFLTVRRRKPQRQRAAA